MAMSNATLTNTYTQLHLSVCLSICLSIYMSIGQSVDLATNNVETSKYAVFIQVKNVIRVK